MQLLAESLRHPELTNSQQYLCLPAQVFGKLDIKWRNSMGEIGRLQTQPISMAGFQQKEHFSRGELFFQDDLFRAHGAFQPFAFARSAAIIRSTLHLRSLLLADQNSKGGFRQNLCCWYPCVTKDGFVPLLQFRH